ncbi:MAG: hypothetical protein O3B82_01300 [Bacteroidetes bacterium]|nr:hypothetical protein [Bacteroidota bacterium]
MKLAPGYVHAGLVDGSTYKEGYQDGSKAWPSYAWVLQIYLPI